MLGALTATDADFLGTSESGSEEEASRRGEVRVRDSTEGAAATRSRRLKRHTSKKDGMLKEALSVTMDKTTLTAAGSGRGRGGRWVASPWRGSDDQTRKLPEL
jgi:hypothetical protein